MITAILLTLGCERPVEVSRGKPVQKIERQSCRTSGYCMHYDWNEHKYKFGHSYGCPGHRQVTVEDTLVEYMYKSGKKPNFTRVESRNVNFLTDCER